MKLYDWVAVIIFGLMALATCIILAQFKEGRIVLSIMAGLYLFAAIIGIIVKKLDEKFNDNLKP